ncbi:MAG: hypothetical protein ABIQ93_02635 [Saprospiraceae bacterium]
MKNSFLILLFILIAGNISRFGGPWWAVAPVAALAVLLFPVGPGRAFAIGLIAGSLLWWASALWLNVANGGLLAGKIGQLFQGVKGLQLLAVTALLGSLLGSFGALTGAYARALFVPQKQQRRKRRR